MNLLPEESYHIYNRGNNRQLLFYHKDNYKLFLRLIKKYLVPNCDILAFCLMPNHFHFLLRANKNSNLPYRRDIENVESGNGSPLVRLNRFSRGLQLLLSTYTKTMNKRYHRTGSLFTQNTRIKRTTADSLLDNYSLWCFIYIHNNPLTAGLVTSPEQWEFSSYRDFLYHRTDSICNLDLAFKELRLADADLFTQKEIEIPGPILAKIR